MKRRVSKTLWERKGTKVSERKKRQKKRKKHLKVFSSPATHQEERKGQKEDGRAKLIITSE
jgi:hypothetical protein